MLIARVAAAIAGLALSSLSAFGESPQIAAVSGRDALALHDLASGACVPFTCISARRSAAGSMPSFSTMEMNGAHPRVSVQRIRRCC
jgi:hypothetical protein